MARIATTMPYIPGFLSFREYPQQIELASSVCREDRLDKDPPAFIGGADVGFEQGGEVTRAAMVLLKISVA